jgi:hypothetical protein
MIIGPPLIWLKASTRCCLNKLTIALEPIGVLGVRGWWGAEVGRGKGYGGTKEISNIRVPLIFLAHKPVTSFFGRQALNRMGNFFKYPTEPEPYPSLVGNLKFFRTFGGVSNLPTVFRVRA